MADMTVGHFSHTQSISGPNLKGSFMQRAVNLVALTVTVHRERLALKRMTARDLQDIGMAAETAETEWNRPFWDLPLERL